ncbi:hypothetical protein ACA910_003900 [Epithemia clementina (nom. ined.)]
MFLPSEGQDPHIFHESLLIDNLQANSVPTASEKHGQTTRNQSSDEKREDAVYSHSHFILFKGGGSSQGAGNHLQGLLAAHLFGLEFNRTVCIKWSDFWEAFEYKDPEHAKLCQNVKFRSSNVALSLWNYGSGQYADECLLYDQLSAQNNTVVAMTGNTYPGWRTEIPPNFFHRYYRPKQALVNSLPYDPNKPPKVVVHLRIPDGSGDQDRGLDEESLTYLGQMLRGKETYLVTNRPGWYRRFNECCGWSYDMSWEDKPIKHGSMDLVWLSNGEQLRGKENVEILFKETDSNTTAVVAQDRHGNNQNLKLWSDWYTMLRAEKVYHSNSDFSRSAVHWNANGTGYQLAGMKRVTEQQSSHDNNETKQSPSVRVRVHRTQVSAANATSNTPKRTLHLIPAPYDAVAMRIPPIVERIRDGNGTMHSEDDCVYLRFCGYRRQIGVSPSLQTKES